MSKTSTVLDRPVAADPIQGKTPTIDPMRVFGFREAVETAIKNGTKPVLPDHPEFPNPRHRMNQELVDQIRSDGKVYDPVDIVIASDGAIVIWDGKTRLQAVAEAYVEDPKTLAFSEIPYTLSELDKRTIHAEAVRRGLEDERQPLSPYEQAIAIKRLMDEDGYTKEDIVTALGITNRGGMQRLLTMLRILDASAKVIKAWQTGKIDLTDANLLAQEKSATKQNEKLEKLLTAKSKGGQGRDARKAAGLKQPNFGTLGWKEAIINFGDNVYPEAKRLFKEGLHLKDPDSVNWGNRDERNDYLSAQETLTRYSTTMQFFKLDGVPLREQFEAIETRLSDEQRSDLIQWMPPAEKPKAPAAPKSKDAPKAPAKATLKKPSGKPNKAATTKKITVVTGGKGSTKTTGKVRETVAA